MKLKTLSMFSALLLALAAASFAEGAGNAPAQTAAVAQAAAEAPAVPASPAEADAPVLLTSQSSLESNCDQAASPPLFQLAFEKPVAGLAINCGPCSQSQCRGARIGQICWTGGVNGHWGNCNLYTGGNFCEEGGWECQCGSGPLP